jgi:peptidoglycan L-alanyl-D-glutamate endopeptidase CwlK
MQGDVMSSRKIKDLTPRMQEKILFFERCLNEAGLGHFKKCSTFRSQLEQDALYMQGRKPLEEVNAARRAVGLWEIDESTNKRKVTWVKVSVHTSREAVDYFALVDGKYCNDLKVDVDKDSIPDWQEFGKIAEECGLTWGGRWRSPDYPHVQWRDV